MKSSFWAVPVLLIFTACSHQPIRKTHTPYPSEVSGAVPQQDLVRKVQSLYQSGDYTNALALLNSTPESAVPMSEVTEYHNLKGLVLLEQKQPLQAESSFRKALDTNSHPEYRGYYQYNLASALFEGDKSGEALDILNAIDLTHLDPVHQQKVLTLKEKITSKQYANAGASPAPGMNRVTGPNALPTPPQETYSGPVNPSRIGLLLPLSGKYEEFGKRAQRTIELAFQTSKESRAQNYELIAVDSGETTESRVEAMRKLVEDDHVIAVIGPILSTGLEELAARADYYQVPLVSIAQVQGPITSDLFSCTISPRDQASIVIDYAMKVKGFSRFAILAPSNNPGEELANAFWDEINAHNGEVKAFELYPPSMTDFRPPVDRALGLHYTDARENELKELSDKRKEMKIIHKTMRTAQYFNLRPVIDFDAVIIADEAKIVGQIIPTFAFRDAKNLSYLGISSWNSTQLVQRAQEQANGAIFPVALNTLNPPSSTQAFYDLYVATYNAYPGEFDALAFDAASMVIQAGQDSPSSRNDFRKSLEDVKDVEAATGSVSMVDHHCARHLELYTVQKGKIIPVK